MKSNNQSSYVNLIPIASDIHVLTISTATLSYLFIQSSENFGMDSTQALLVPGQEIKNQQSSLTNPTFVFVSDKKRYSNPKNNNFMIRSDDSVRLSLVASAIVHINKAISYPFISPKPDKVGNFLESKLPLAPFLINQEHIETLKKFSAWSMLSDGFYFSFAHS